MDLLRIERQSHTRPVTGLTMALAGRIECAGVARLTRMGLTGLLLVALNWASCGYFETGYFQSKVNHATQGEVAKRYGTPHKIQALDGGEVWIYYDRASATASYTGYARETYCQAYMLSFDKEGILRDWKQEKCKI